MKLFLIVCLAAAAYGASLRRQLSESDAFAAYDANGDGQITTSEIHAYMVSQGFKDNDMEDEEMEESDDFNGDGVITNDELAQIYNVISQGVQKRQVDEADAFNAYDRNQDGSISAFEAAVVIAELGLTATDADVDQAVANADSNGDGSVSRDEFDVLFDGIANLQLSEADAFAAYDANGDGVITKEEFHALLAADGVDDNDAMDQEGIESTDLNGDGVVDNNEFQDIYNAVAKGASRKNKGKLDEQDSFRAYDADRDGKISRIEVEGVIEKLDLIATDADVDAAIANADANGDGVVTKDEFDAIYNAIASLTPDSLPEDDAFSKYDGNGDGKITEDDLKAFLSANGYDASNEGADKGMIESLDTNGDGAVDKSEFDAVYQTIINGADKKRQLDENTAFNAYDRNRDGNIDDVEAADVIDALNLEATNDQVNAAIGNADANGDGVVSRDEFDAIYNSIASLTPDSLPEGDAFASYDANGDGKITEPELEAFLTANGYDASNTDADKVMIETLDTNGDGGVDKQEFDFVYQNVINGADKKRQIDEADAFNAYDRNQDGQITAYEVAAVIGQLGLTAGEAEVTAALSNADANGDGVVTRDEFDGVFNAVAGL